MADPLWRLLCALKPGSDMPQAPPPWVFDVPAPNIDAAERIWEDTYGRDYPMIHVTAIFQIEPGETEPCAS